MTVPGMIVLVWAGVFGMMMFPLTEHWGQFGFEPLTSSCTLGRGSENIFFNATHKSLMINNWDKFNWFYIKRHSGRFNIPYLQG